MCTFGVLGLSCEAPRMGPEVSGPPLPDFGVWVFGVRGPGLNVSLWVWGLGFWGSENLT